jgi:hypothetical protein
VIRREVRLEFSQKNFLRAHDSLRGLTRAQSEGCSKGWFEAVIVPWGDETFSLAPAMSNPKKFPAQKNPARPNALIQNYLLAHAVLTFRATNGGQAASGRHRRSPRHPSALFNIKLLLLLL